MHILVTGANGYIGIRLILALLEQSYQVTAVVRDRRRFPLTNFGKNETKLKIVEADFLDVLSLDALPKAVDAVFYLLHSMGAKGDFSSKEALCAENFSEVAERNLWQRVIYLGGLVGEVNKLSKHLLSRLEVENILKRGVVPLTVLRASIIVGSGSASFEIIRDLAEKLPILITPRWVQTKCQPIAIRNVIDYLTAVLKHPETLNQCYDMGGPEVMTYLDLIKQYSQVRGLKRIFLPTRLLTPRLSSGWLRIFTSTTFPLARSLVDSLTQETICHNLSLRDVVPLDLFTYKEAVKRALAKIAQNHVPSSWIGSLAAGTLSPNLFDAIKVPEHGILLDSQWVRLEIPREQVLNRIWSIGGAAGWPSMNWAWNLRGFIDKLVGGVGIRRGRRHPEELFTGDALDFWRVLLADREGGRLMLYAEMRLPGEAWLEFAIEEKSTGELGLRQTATFRPHGVLGRLYWYILLPFHSLLFPRMARNLALG